MEILGKMINKSNKKTDNFILTCLKEYGSFMLMIFGYIVFWLLFFQVCRIMFLIYHQNNLSVIDRETLVKIFLYGLYMDLSVASYLLVFPFLLRFAASIFSFPSWKRTVDIYSMFFIGVVAFITVSDLEVYREWGVKLNVDALAYLRYPEEAFASVSASPLPWLVFMLIVCATVGYCIYRFTFKKLPEIHHDTSSNAIIFRVICFPIFICLIFLGIRGGISDAPMNPSVAYFSTHKFANHAALNASWFLLYDIKYYFKDKGSQFIYMPEEEMLKRVDRILAKNAVNDTDYILTTDRPNIICFILESWTADLINALGAEKGITPSFEKMISDGLLFTNFYANGYRTSFGIPAVLSGFPSTPQGSVLYHPLKMEKLPTMADSLKKAGYQTSFYYGGDKHFDDMNAFFVHSGFEKVTDKFSFDKKEMNSKWGVHDHVTFNRMLSDFKGAKSPFFSSILTLSSHEPYEVPMETVFKGGDLRERFKNSVYYSDRSIGEFMDKAKMEIWYKNTLFIFVADHGHILPLNRHDNTIPERYHIPLLLYGEAIKKQYWGKRNLTIGSQADIVTTVLSQLKLPHGEFEWSSNLLNRKRNEYAYYNFKDGFVWKTPGITAGFDNLLKQPVLLGGARLGDQATDEALKDGEAYLQYLFGKYKKL